MKEGAYLPVAMSWAPVRVAMSTTTSGSKYRDAKKQPSASTRRPSASVLLICKNIRIKLTFCL